MNNKKRWKDHGSPKDIDFSLRFSFEGFKVDMNNYPTNPVEDKTLKGKGVLYRWGPNLAGDAVVTKTKNSQRYVLLIKRKSGEWALPGGMQDEGENLKDTVARELKEETNLNLDFSSAKIIYSGYVKDPRNTKNAWIETMALHYELSDVESNVLQSVAGDDARDVAWVKISSIENNLYASHYSILQRIKN